MSRTLVLLASLLFAAPALAAGTATSEDMKYVYEYGEALYHAYQGEWFDAIARLDAAQLDQPGGPGGSGDGEPAVGTGRLVGDFELNYRMDNRAGRAIEAVIESTVWDDVRNEAIFRLARMYFQKDQPEDALHAVERVRGVVPKAIRPDLAFLHANILMAVGRNAEAVVILKDLLDEKKLKGFSSYNLGIALLRTGDEQGGREYLDRTGRIKSDDRAVQAIRDKANLVLGDMLLGEKDFKAAKEVLDRVRLNGPFSNRALLGSGWADTSRDRFEKALVPWSILAGREVADPAVQEAMLAVPYAYSKLGVYSTAALKYEAALQAFGEELGKLDASIASIREGTFLKGLLREKLRQDADWAVNLRDLPKTPETYYLLDLMASNDFQESLRNYLDLEELRKKLDTWSGDLVAFEDIIRKRRAHYEPLLPAIDRAFARLEAEKQSELERRNRIAGQLDAMQAAPRPDLLITADERSMMEQLDKLESLATPGTKEIAPRFLERVRRLRAVLYWNTHANYDKRYADARDRLRDLDRELDRLDRQCKAFASSRQTAIESYEGHDDVIGSERLRIEAARKKMPALMALQGRVLEIMAVNELTRRRHRLEDLRVKASYGLADSYDRAGKAEGRKNAP
jgi:hypothetical protein